MLSLFAVCLPIDDIKLFFSVPDFYTEVKWRIGKRFANLPVLM